MAKKKTEDKVPTVEAALPVPVGRPSTFREEFVEQTAKLCALGATDDDLADFFDVSPRTLNRWKATHPEFMQALRRGKDPADDRVEASLYQKALPREIEEEQAIKLKEVTYNDSGKRLKEVERVEVVKVRKFVPADTTAIIFWLKNRRPDQWRDVHKVEHSGAVALASLTPEELDDFLLQGIRDITPLLQNGPSTDDADIEE